MKLESGKIYFFSLLLIFLSSPSFCQETTNAPPSVSIKYIVFNETNFQEIVDSHDNVLLYFTANWSADSQNKKQNFMNIKDGLLDIKKAEDNRDNFIVVGEVNSKNYKICHDFNIKKYPSIVLISGKRHHLYKGDIEPEQILEWLRHFLVKKTIKFDTYEQLDAAFQREHLLVMFYGEPKDNKTEFEIFFNMTERFQHLHFYHFSNETILLKLNITENITNPSVIILKTFDEELNVYAGHFSEEDVYGFIKIYARPVMSTLNGDSYLYVVNERISFISLLINENHTNYEEIREHFYESSYKYRSVLMSFLGDVEDLRGTTLTYEFGIKSQDLPLMIIEEFTPEKTIRRYKSTTQDLKTKEGVQGFFDGFFFRSLKRYLKSEKAPAVLQKTGNVYNLVGENFESIILKEDKFIFTLFTRRNCGLCNEFEKNFNRLAEDLSITPDVLFAKIDGVENELEKIEIKGYPSFILFTKGSEKYTNYILFEEVPSFITLKEFIKVHVKSFASKEDIEEKGL